MGVVSQPEMKAGDVIFFMDGAQTHGTLPWRGEHPRRSILFKYADRTSVRAGVSREIAPPEIYWGEELVEGMTEAGARCYAWTMLIAPCHRADGGRRWHGSRWRITKVNPRNKRTFFQSGVILLQLWHIHQIYANASFSL